MEATRSKGCAVVSRYIAEEMESQMEFHCFKAVFNNPGPYILPGKWTSKIFSEKIISSTSFCLNKASKYIQSLKTLGFMLSVVLHVQHDIDGIHSASNCFLVFLEMPNNFDPLAALLSQYSKIPVFYYNY